MKLSFGDASFHITRGQFFAYIVLPACWLYMCLDTSLSNESKKALDLVSVQENTPNNAFYYHMGIDAPIGTSPVDRGKQLVKKYRDTNFFDETSSDIALEQLDALPKITLPESDHPLLCSLYEDGCKDTLVNLSTTWKSDITHWRTIYERYLTFIGFTDYATQLTYAPNTPLAPSRILVYGGKISALNAITMASSGELTKAVDNLNTEQQKIRHHLAHSDQLVHKMVFLSLFEQNIETLLLLKQLYPTENFQQIASLSTQELDLEPALAFESAMGYRTMQDLYNNYKHEQENPIAKAIVYMMMRLGFKPNMTTNAYTKDISYAVMLSKTPQEKTAAFLENPFKPKKLYSPRNIIGSILSNTIEPTNYDKYPMRLFDINCKIALINHVLSHESSNLLNPYGGKFKIKQLAQKTCMEGPLPDQNNKRCISRVS